MEKMHELIKTLKDISNQQIEPYLPDGKAVPENEIKNADEINQAPHNEEKLADLIADIKAEFSTSQKS